MTLQPAAAGRFSLAEARAIVRDLFAPREWIYWVDFLTTIFIGHVCATLARLVFDLGIEPLWLRLSLAAAAFVVQCVCFYRGVMFIHEIVHLPERKFGAFRVVWNLLCGIPFLVPSFTYYSHLDHHRRKLFGTAGDGEYLPLARMSPWWIVVYLSQCLWAPPLAVVRFGLITPLTWFSPRFRQFIHRRMSSLVMDPMYIRPLPTKAALRMIRLQEVGCFCVLIGYVVFPLVVLDRWPIPLAIQAYLTGATLVLMNSLRTLASHQWSSDGEEGTFVDQMLDSVTLDSQSLGAVIINPVGLRYHATHHLFPSLPYHNIRAAHERLMERLPADSLYRRTVARSLWGVIVDLWRRAAEHETHRKRRTSLLAGSKLAPGAM
jgi:fatty acid desaturase